MCSAKYKAALKKDTDFTIIVDAAEPWTLEGPAGSSDPKPLGRYRLLFKASAPPAVSPTTSVVIDPDPGGGVVD